MSLQCPNCNQSVLKEDSVCWHCGTALRAAGEEETASIKDRWAEPAAAGAPSNLVVYSVMTAVIILLALLVTVYLGRQPLVQAADPRPPDGWAYVSNLRRNMTVMLPEDWHLFDADSSDSREDVFAQLIEQYPVLTAATAPLGALAEGTTVVFVATENLPDGTASPGDFLVLAQSSVLGGVSHEEAVSLVGEADILSATPSAVDNFDKSHLALEVRLAEPYNLECRQQFVSGNTYGLILAVCGQDENQMTTILDSFQRLSR